MITPGELENLLKAHKWIISISTSGKQEVYAAKKRQGKKVVTRYLATANRLNDLSEEDILGKLNRTTQTNAPSQQ